MVKLPDTLPNLSDYERLVPASHIVFRVRYGIRDAVLKVQPDYSFLRELYYGSQDFALFHEWIRHVNPKDDLAVESDKLRKLPVSINVPRLFKSDEKGKWLIREYIPGTDFRRLSEREQEFALKGGLEVMLQIHGQGMVIGDAHVKNLLLSLEEKVYWIDLGGSFDESDFYQSKVRDLLKFIVSTYLASNRNQRLTVEAARLVKNSGVEKKLVQDAKSILHDTSDLILWYPTRFPLDGVLKEKVLDAL